MRFIPAFTAAAGLLLALAAGKAFSRPATAAVAGASSPSRILVQDRFLDDTNRAALLCRADAYSTNEPCSCRTQMPVPGWFSNRLLSVIGRGGEAIEGAHKAPDADVLLPVYEMVGDHPEHQDRHVSGANQGALAEGHVGVVYLEGDGDFVLTDTATGAEHREPIRPGKLISWPNAGFTHRVEGASAGRRRRMLGPMAFDAASHALVGVGTFQQCYPGYMCAVPDEPDHFASATDGPNCAFKCEKEGDPGPAYSQWDGQTCACFDFPCAGFVESTDTEYYFDGNRLPACPQFVPVTTTCHSNHECLFPVAAGTVTATNSNTCGYNCQSDDPWLYSQWDGTTCTCFATACTSFAPKAGTNYSAYFDETCPPLTLVTGQPTVSPTKAPTATPIVTDPISIAASSAGRSGALRGGLYALRVVVTLPAATSRALEAEEADDQADDHDQEEERELLGWGGSHKPLNITDYAVRVTVPTGSQVTYKRTSVSPGLKPASLKTPAVQANGDLLWARVPIPRYRTKAFKRTFKVVFKVSTSATSPLVFGASVWKGDVKITDATPVTVTVTGGK